MRIACIHVPHLALQAVLRRDPERKDEAMALAEGPSERARILASNRRAYQAGVRPGQTVSQARSMAAGFLGGDHLVVHPPSPVDTTAAAAALCDVAFSFAPTVESESERAFLDVETLQGLYPQGEQAIVQAIAARAAAVGLAVRVAIASSKAVARVAAQVSDLAVVAPGQERTFLAPLSVETALSAGIPPVLGPEAKGLLPTLRRFGTPTLGAIAALPAAELTLRLGRLGAFLHALAVGTADEPFAPCLPPDALEEGTDIEYPLAEIEPLAFVLRGLVDRALARLSCRGLACAELSLRFKLDPQGFDVREVPLGAPTRETATLLQLIRLDLARRPPAAPIVGGTVRVLPARVRATQMDFWRPAGPAPEKLAATVARLSALVGPENVGAPALVDTFREEAIAIRPYRYTEAAPIDSGAADGDELALAFRRFRPPWPLEVLMDRDGPSALRGKQIVTRILVAAGPYRSSGNWWDEESFGRDYWDVHAADGAVYRLHQEKRSGEWFLDGYYD